MAGRKPIPTQLKLVKGTARKDRTNTKEPKLPPGIPECPVWLDDVGRAEFKRTAELLHSAGVLTLGDRDTLANYCHITSQIQKLATEIREQDYVVYSEKIDSRGNEYMDAKANPRAMRLEKMLSEHRQYSSLLGLNPATRSKIVAEGNDDEKPDKAAKHFR